jgi:hypothetical protein
LFEKVASTLQHAAQLQSRSTAAGSSLARAVLAPDVLAARRSLEELGRLVDARQCAIESQLGDWDGTAPSLAAWAREAAFLEKWQSQLRAALAELTPG